MEKSNFIRTFFAATLLVHGMGLTIFWFLRVRYGTNRRGVSKKTASMCTPSRGHIIIQGTDTTLGVEPRSRQHDTSVCSPLHHIGKAVAVNPKKVPSLCSLVTEEIATYILQPVDWLARPASVPLKGEAKHFATLGV